MFFNQLCQDSCQRQDETFISLERNISEYKMKLIEKTMKIIELVSET